MTLFNHQGEKVSLDQEKVLQLLNHFKLLNCESYKNKEETKNKKPVFVKKNKEEEKGTKKKNKEGVIEIRKKSY